MSQNNIIKDLIQLASTSIEFDYETLDEMLKYKRSFETTFSFKVIAKIVRSCYNTYNFFSLTLKKGLPELYRSKSKERLHIRCIRS